MSTTDPCSCHDAARWKRRALAAELSLAFTRRQLETILALMPGPASQPPLQPEEREALNAE